MNKKIFIYLISLFVFFIGVSPVLAQEFAKSQTLRAKIIGVSEESLDSEIRENAGFQPKKIQLEIISEPLRGKIIEIEADEAKQNYQLADQVLLNYSLGADQQEIFIITDHYRLPTLLYLFAIFLILVVLIAKKRGVLALFGMLLSFLVIFYLVLPQIASGANPVTIAILASLLIIPSTFYLSHGLNKKTTVAIMGTLIALVITSLLADAFIKASKLSGFSSEEAMFLMVEQGEKINIQGLLLAGIIIGVLGVLDDITIAQSAIVFNLKKNNSKLSAKELYQQAMNIGQDHIASMVNTLILVYAGASLPLLLLFINSSHPISEILNYEIVAEEIIRTLVASIGLISAVPITNLIASLSTSIEFRKGK